MPRKDISITLFNCVDFCNNFVSFFHFVHCAVAKITQYTYRVRLSLKKVFQDTPNIGFAQKSINMMGERFEFREKRECVMD